MTLIYLSGPYSEYKDKYDVVHTVNENIEVARAIAIRLWEFGYYVICPHTNTGHFEGDADVSWETYLNGYIKMIDGCDYVVLLPGWKNSKGAVIEYHYAQIIKKQTFEYISGHSVIGNDIIFSPHGTYAPLKRIKDVFDISWQDKLASTD